MNKRKLLDHQTRISTKQKLKEQSQKRRSYNVGAMPPPVLHKKSTNPHNSTVNSSLKPETKRRKGSTSLAVGAPWNPDDRPRYHEDPLAAVSALIHVLDISK